MANEITTLPDHGDRLVQIATGVADPRFQIFLDEIVLRLNRQLLGAAIPLASYTVANVPDAEAWTGAVIYVSNESGGAVPAFSDGTDWRRFTDRAVIS